MSGIAQMNIQQDQKSKNVPQVLLEDKDYYQQFEEKNGISLVFPDTNDMLQQPSNLKLFTVMEPNTQDNGEKVLTNSIPPPGPDKCFFIYISSDEFPLSFITCFSGFISAPLEPQPGYCGGGGQKRTGDNGNYLEEIGIGIGISPTLA